MLCQFLSTLSLRRATCSSFVSTSSTVISIHALLAESDLAALATEQQTRAISIHALLAESDQLILPSRFTVWAFLSTLSLRRATNVVDTPVSVFCISIHALLAESDQQEGHRTKIHHPFLSTLSLRRATKRFWKVYHLNKFLSTLSLRRATTVTARIIDPTFDFYPRSPCGERPKALFNPIQYISFLSTLSLRRATISREISLIRPYAFLSTLSLRRATHFVHLRKKYK